MGIEKKGKHDYENVGKAGSHGKFSTKKAAREQQKAMYSNGFKGEPKHGNK
jgi:hypothetical protein